MKNTLKEKLSRGMKCSVAWNQSGSILMSEIFARASFDAVILDMEHGPFSYETAVQHCLALSAHPTCALARISHADTVVIRRSLDLGLQGIMVPQIKSVEDVEITVKATHYPLKGNRGVAKGCRAAGYGFCSEEYFRHANDEIFVMPMVETIEAIEQIDKIVAIEGVDAFFIGPLDLAASMGHLENPNAKPVKEAIAHALNAILKSGRWAGTVGTTDTMKEKIDMGFSILTLISDTMNLVQQSHNIITQYQKITSPKNSIGQV